MRAGGASGTQPPPRSAREPQEAIGGVEHRHLAAGSSGVRAITLELRPDRGCGRLTGCCDMAEVRSALTRRRAVEFAVRHGSKATT